MALAIPWILVFRILTADGDGQSIVPIGGGFIGTNGVETGVFLFSDGMVPCSWFLLIKSIGENFWSETTNKDSIPVADERNQPKVAEKKNVSFEPNPSKMKNATYIISS